MKMPKKELKEFDPEEILQEIRAREHRDKGEIPILGLSKAARAPAIKMSPEGKGELNLLLKEYETKELITNLHGVQKVIYGVDDRDDVYEVNDPKLLKDADSVAALVSTGSIVDNGDGTSTLNGQSLGNVYNLCNTEPFRDQPSIAFCSGFLVDPSIIVSAGHCVNEANLNNFRFIFEYEMSDATTAETTISNDEIYRGVRILGRQQVGAGADWAVVQLDRPVLNHPNVRIRRSGKIPNNESVHVIGHPSGIPKKIAGGSNVRDNNPSSYFVANLDTYGGNSGSPVFSSNTHVVEGILVRGETDYVWNGTCRVSNVCPANGCRGEDCTRTTEFDHLIPRNQHDFIPFRPDIARVVQRYGRWKITVGNMWLLDFGRSRAEAQKALKIIKHYGMNAQCFVGRPNPSMEFYLVDGEAPVGAMRGEDAIGFNPQNIIVERARGRWKITEGNHWIMDFDQNEAEARQALSYILRYGFKYICFVGRPGPSMTYFRK